MAPRRESIIPVLKVTDLLVLTATFIAAIGLALSGTDPVQWPGVFQIRISVQNALFFSAYLGAWHLILSSVGLYRSYRLAPASREVGRIGVAVVLGGAPIYPVGKLIGFSYATTSFLIAFMALAFLGLTFERRGLRLVARVLRRRGMNLKNALIVGDRCRGHALRRRPRRARRSRLPHSRGPRDRRAIGRTAGSTTSSVEWTHSRTATGSTKYSSCCRSPRARRRCASSSPFAKRKASPCAYSHTSPISPTHDSSSTRSPASPSCRWSADRATRLQLGLKRAMDLVGAAAGLVTALTVPARGRDRHQARLARAGGVRPGANRAQSAALQDLQVPHDARGRRQGSRAARAPERGPRAGVQDQGRPARSPASAVGFGKRASTSSRSSGTCSRAT